MSFLQVTWYFLIGLFLLVYAILDGFDLGVGFWYLFSKRNRDRRLMRNAIGPVWDGNEVWLLTGGAAIFAAFPEVYATVFSGFYLALMLVIFALIFRAVSIEFRGKLDTPGWGNFWDATFGIGSILPALLFGVAVGNILRGLPLDSVGNFAGTFFTLLNPYALLIGLLGLAMFVTHGALYLVLRTNAELSAKAKRWAHRAWWLYLILFIIAALLTMTTRPQLLLNYNAVPVLWILPFLSLLVIILIGVFNRQGRAKPAFAASVLSIVGLMALCAAGLFPNMVPALGTPELSLTLVNASSSPLTLWTMLVIAVVGMPLVVIYTIWAYRTFGGKVELEEGY
ncbi:MAG: cytochrome D oxidase subunit I [candidate division Zixibacteria bacterium DG_27]|nr:MAG: cytochrome D oxidase subunit I [candidate division Zixibacteria bacterium DG_27]